MGMLNASTQVMNRSMTAIGRARGKVTKKKAVFPPSVRSLLPSSVYRLVAMSVARSGSFFNSCKIFSLLKESFALRESASSLLFTIL